MRHLFSTLTCLAVLLLLATAGFAQQRNTDIENIGNRDINAGQVRPMIPDLEAEIAMGRQAARDLEAQVTLLQDATVAEYVNRVGQIIVRNSDARIPFTIKVVDSAEINGVGLPGGFVYINTGLITASDNEAQLAAMIAHAVAHVTARHAAEQQGRASFINILSVPASIFPTNPAAATSLPTTLFKFGRQAEEEADFLGLQYLYKAGYDPSTMVRFFEKLKTPDTSRQVSTLFSTHPQTEDRIAKTNENIRLYLAPRQQNITTTVEFQNIKTRLLERRQ
jgi:predicted Zn-dependent protease